MRFSNFIHISELVLIYAMLIKDFQISMRTARSDEKCDGQTE